MSRVDDDLSPTSPLRQSLFHMVWIFSPMANVCMWMIDVAATWTLIPVLRLRDGAAVVTRRKPRQEALRQQYLVQPPFRLTPVAVPNSHFGPESVKTLGRTHRR